MAHGLLSTNLNFMFPLIPETVGQSIALNCVLHWSEPGAYKSKPKFTPKLELVWGKTCLFGAGGGGILPKPTGNVSVPVRLLTTC